MSNSKPQYEKTATRQLQQAAAGHAQRPRELVRLLGAQPEDGLVRIGFWTPELAEQGIADSAVQLELIELLDLDLRRSGQECRARRWRLPVLRDGEFTWVAVSGAVVGDRSRVGWFYHLVYTDGSGASRTITDPLAVSVRFGAAAPAELYDLAGAMAKRRDLSHFRSMECLPDADEVARVCAPSNLLEIHVPTATAEGTMQALSERIRAIGDRLRAGTAVSASDRALLGYGAMQLMPVEPTIQFETGEAFWQDSGVAGQTETDTVTLRRPYSTNWGYDVMTSAAPAVNPVLLGSARPHEFLDLIEELHTFPGGAIRVVLDLVFGHADNQSRQLLNRHFFAGPNMYGQNLNYRHPIVRAILLEMLERKAAFGIDGLRVDGAQDFTYWVAEEQQLHHDDEFLAEMNAIEVRVGDVHYRPWMIFEDGRPWPRDDWELASNYREVTRRLPRVVQWGPLTFAHNTPFLFTFWLSKWWRIREVAERGANWITGTSNHDTLRRGTQVSPAAAVNTYLGASLPEIFAKGYDNPATRMLDMMLPGIPMDFLNANMRAPWSFIRNTDSRWGIKVMSEEARFLDWGVTEERFAAGWAFPRLKAHGFRELSGLRRFLVALDAAVRATRYEPASLAALLASVEPALPGPRPLDGPTLTRIARDWMDDLHEYCNLSHYHGPLDRDPERIQGAAHGQAVRQLRLQERWLAGNLRGGDHLSYRHPTEGSVLACVLRHQPDEVDGPDGPRSIAEHAPAARWRRLALLVNLEGEPVRVTPAEAFARVRGDAAAGGRWDVVMTVPALAGTALHWDAALELANSQAVLFGSDSGA